MIKCIGKYLKILLFSTAWLIFGFPNMVYAAQVVTEVYNTTASQVDFVLTSGATNVCTGKTEASGSIAAGSASGIFTADNACATWEITNKGNVDLQTSYIKYWNQFEVAKNQNYTDPEYASANQYRSVVIKPGKKATVGAIGATESSGYSLGEDTTIVLKAASQSLPSSYTFTVSSYSERDMYIKGIGCDDSVMQTIKPGTSKAKVTIKRCDREDRDRGNSTTPVIAATHRMQTPAIQGDKFYANWVYSYKGQIVGSAEISLTAWTDISHKIYNNGVVYDHIDLYGDECGASILKWGDKGYCTSHTANGKLNTVINITNSAIGAKGSGEAICEKVNDYYKWKVNATCDADIEKATIKASQGTFPDKIVVDWNSISSAVSYSIRYRKKGELDWTTAANVASGWSLVTSDYSEYEFSVAGQNEVGLGPWSETAIGYVTIPIAAEIGMVSEKRDVLVNEEFVIVQSWKNTGKLVFDQNYSVAVDNVFGKLNHPFNQALQVGASRSITLNLKAPSNVGTFDFYSSLLRDGRSYATSSTTQIRVWNPATCSQLTVAGGNSLYDKTATVKLTLGAAAQTSIAANVWLKIKGESSAKSYAVTTASSGLEINVHLTDFNEYGTYVVKTVATNPASSAECLTEFTVHELQTPELTIEALVGSDGANGYVLPQVDSQGAIRVNVRTSEGMTSEVTVINKDTGETIDTVNLRGIAGTTGDLKGKRWEGNAWTYSPEYELRVSYKDPTAAKQNKVLSVPIRFILSPDRSQSDLTLQMASDNGYRLSAALVYKPDGMYNAAKQGAWTSKITMQGVSDYFLDFDRFTGNLSQGLNYANSLGKQITVTAKAVPGTGIVLKQSIEITASLKVPLMAVRNMDASDGTFEDIVRIQWSALVDKDVGITYEVLRDEQLIGRSNTTSFDDTALPERGKKYAYKVLPLLQGDRGPGAQDDGYVPLCRAVRLVSAGVNSSMTEMVGLLEAFECLDKFDVGASFDSKIYTSVHISNSGKYRPFSFPIPADLPDGNHVFRLNVKSEGVEINAERVYEVPFLLNRASVYIKGVSIMYDGAIAKPGIEAVSVGRFGFKLEGGDAIGFAEEMR